MTYAILNTAAAARPTEIPAVGAATGGVRAALRAEGLALTIAATAAYAHSGFSWVLFAALFLAPDLSFAAYLLGPRWGAAAYNLVHSTIAPLVLGATGLALGLPEAAAIALIGLAHIGFDRALGYGLKYSVGFGATHLGCARALTEMSPRSLSANASLSKPAWSATAPTAFRPLGVSREAQESNHAYPCD
jgi:hypothetical protein